MADVSTAGLWGNQLRAITFVAGGEEPQVRPRNGSDANFLVDNPRRRVYNASQHGRERLPNRTERRQRPNHFRPGNGCNKRVPLCALPLHRRLGPPVSPPFSRSSRRNNLRRGSVRLPARTMPEDSNLRPPTVSSSSG